MSKHPVGTRWSSSAGRNWPVLPAIAREMGVAAAFCFPLRVGLARLGALSLLRTHPIEVDDEEYLDCIALGDTAPKGHLSLASAFRVLESCALTQGKSIVSVARRLIWQDGWRR